MELGSESGRMSGIDRDKWLAALKDAASTPLPASNAVTIREFAEITGFNVCHATRKMRQLVEAGKATATRKNIRRSDGAILSVPAYVLKD